MEPFYRERFLICHFERRLDGSAEFNMKNVEETDRRFANKEEGIAYVKRIARLYKRPLYCVIDQIDRSDPKIVWTEDQGDAEMIDEP